MPFKSIDDYSSKPIIFPSDQWNQKIQNHCPSAIITQQEQPERDRSTVTEQNFRNRNNLEREYSSYYPRNKNQSNNISEILNQHEGNSSNPNLVSRESINRKPTKYRKEEWKRFFKGSWNLNPKSNFYTTTVSFESNNGARVNFHQASQRDWENLVFDENETNHLQQENEEEEEGERIYYSNSTQSVLNSSESKSHQEKNTSETEKECSICFTGLHAKYSVALPCSHVFHQSCIRQWLAQKSTCPLCRITITE
eukprot:gb/GECH01007425.1/.p1 GENE.gb/GECH01007425.1/~~gb/GECH01007425.1/.p1  ORF type:complete len:253 (+),score=73.38 gb/GECH01007425.1/:1-759(+)